MRRYTPAASAIELIELVARQDPRAVRVDLAGRWLDLCVRVQDRRAYRSVRWQVRMCVGELCANAVPDLLDGR
ncbi:hypothetical protein LAUMK13_02877 [Mycobacterium innocens]|uniref:Uncharacterized protein n=1 Tax=Mycobacterium innocens TaxID=2341083 RepID=A0A498Q633_9MYCO|nr:hypothetical protein LAUMK13_02877 [Mycobacterium innocens]